MFSEGYMFRIELKNKGNPAYTIDNPSAYLSEKSIARRQKQGIAIDSTDLPVDLTYLEKIKSTGAAIRATSKWVKTVTVYLPDSSAVLPLKAFDFVDTLYCVWKGTLPSSDLLKSGQDKFARYEEESPAVTREMSVYGAGYEQISMLNGDLLHNAGFRGKGMSIAVLDIGFQNSDRISSLDFSYVKEVRNFTHKTGNPLTMNEGHGTSVLSCMLANSPGIMIGTAPEADFYLFKTEVEGEEYPVEEDYWVAAMEYADSIGVDVVNTSLGYSTFTDPAMNHTYTQLDGYTIPASRAGSIAGNKGMLIFNSAGNEGNKSWGKITVPSDAKNIITVGAVNSSEEIAAFSSRGTSSDGRIKPDLSAMGESAALIRPDGSVIRGNGTSFSSPVLTGAGACLWQALPQKTSKEIIALMQSVGNKAASPDSDYGYGIPDLWKAYMENATEIVPVSRENRLIYFDSTENRLFLNGPDSGRIDLQIFNSVGQLVVQHKNITTPVDLNDLNHGVYIARVRQDQKQAVQKFIKW